tara:strand:+ start:261 stop:761 length:501 start_codon:yes stop_codon:yes gene_type:complete
MNIRLIILSVLLFFKCKDTDLIIENIDFSDSALEICLPNITNKLFIKIKGSETLVLVLSDNLPVEEGLSKRSFNADNYLLYRKYSDNLSSNYFCSIITPKSPVLITELIPISGELEIKTSLLFDENGDFLSINYNLKIKDLLLQNENGDTLIQDTLEFGSLTFISI